MTFSFFSLISQIFQFFYPEFFQSFGLVDEYLCTRHCMVRRWKLEKRRLWRNHRVAKEGKWASGKLPGSRITTQAPGEDCQWISWWLCKTSASASFILAWAFFLWLLCTAPCYWIQFWSLDTNTKLINIFHTNTKIITDRRQNSHRFRNWISVDLFTIYFHCLIESDYF